MWFTLVFFQPFGKLQFSETDLLIIFLIGSMIAMSASFSNLAEMLSFPVTQFSPNASIFPDMFMTERLESDISYGYP